MTLVRGERSSAYPPGQFEALVERLADARCEVLAGLSHLGPLEDPGAIADCIRRVTAPQTSPSGATARAARRRR